MRKVNIFLIAALLFCLATGVTYGIMSAVQSKKPVHKYISMENTTNTVLANISNNTNSGISVVPNDGTNTSVNTQANENTNSVVNRTTNTNSSTIRNSNTTTNTSTNTSTNSSTNTTNPPLAPGEIRYSAYTTGYGWPDNTPPGGAVSNPILHHTAGGIGTFKNPITLAVGHSIVSGKDTLDYPAGTKFYIPAFRRYFVVEDTCGDGSLPQNGPCHVSSEPGHVQLDIWVGGQGASTAAVYNCESHITGVHVVIQNPASTYAVVPGAVFDGSCSPLYGDTIILQ